jgi:glycosyltransferase involved in cell wall biosynthesis
MASSLAAIGNQFAVRYCYVRVPHFMARSGYELVATLQRDTPEVSIARQGELWPRHRIFRHSQTLIRAISRTEEYSFGAAALEARTALRMCRSRRHVFHFLYGEQFCRFTPYLNGWRDNLIVASFHLTPEQLTERLHATGHLRHLAAVVILGENQRAFFEQYVSPDLIWFVPHGVDIAYFHPLPDRPRHTEPLCVCIGGHLRDFETLADAIAIVHAKGFAVRFEVIARRLQAAAVRGLPGVHLRDYVSDAEMLRLYQEADVMVLSYKDAVASNVLVEGMACGAPLVVTDIGAVRDYIDESAARLIAPRSPEAMAEAIISLAADPARAACLGHKARQRAVSLDHAKIALQLANVYQRAVQQHQSREHHP